MDEIIVVTKQEKVVIRIYLVVMKIINPVISI